MKKGNIQNIFSACAFFSGYMINPFDISTEEGTSGKYIFDISLFLFHIMSIRLFTFVLIILIMLKRTLNHI